MINREINPYDQPEFISTCYYRWGSNKSAGAIFKIACTRYFGEAQELGCLFAAGLFILINRITGAVFGVTSAMLLIRSTFTRFSDRLKPGLLGQCS